MAFQGWTAPLLPTPAYDAAAYNTSVTLTDVSPVPQVTVRAGTAYPGRTWYVRGLAKFSTTGTPTTLNGVYWGGVAGVKLAATAATATASTAGNFPIQMEAWITCRSTGTSGSMLTSGRLYLGTSLTAMTLIPIDSAAVAAVTVDTTVDKTITWGSQWGTSNASNTLTVVQFTVQDLG